jgi:hypothetical protein
MATIKFTGERTWQGRTIPCLDNIDPLNPRQAFLWMFTGAGFSGFPMLHQSEYWESISEHLVECLGIPLDENGRLLEPIGKSLGWEARRKYLPPPTILIPSEAAGKWVTADEPDPEPESVDSIMERIPHHEQVAAATWVQQRLGITPDTVMPGLVTVKDFATQVKLTPKQAVDILADWGIKATVKGTIDRQKAIKIMRDLQRKQQ